MYENLVNSIQQLIILGKGDRGRLEYILDLLQKGKVLPSSDQKYLEIIIPLYLGSNDPEPLQKHTEYVIGEMHKEIQTLRQKILRLERKGFEKYVGKKAVFFFVTLFVGWNALQTYILSALNPFMSNNFVQYLFPLNVVANYFNADSLVWLGFILMILAWPFIGAIHLTNFIKGRKISDELQCDGSLAVGNNDLVNS